ncbi:hypothetical protein [Agrococcus sp. Marseille-Q4369]|uniref:hypothetical protein n=1 Tax=Agrococcus sp. Marseille-Q4369 TaxID=2810513 RepID=UPI001B8B4E78|nr:hypothetical protein [Agrococcus sp. Marseille-Q4369]QUW18638.1 hypothetical protein JSQ78_12745 [Agrococcus sp. Marseille-Q4369]
MRPIAIATVLLLAIAATACTSDVNEPEATPPAASAEATQAADGPTVGPAGPELTLWVDQAGSVTFLRQAGADSGALPVEGSLTVVDGCLVMTLADETEQRAAVFVEGVEVREDSFTDRQGITHLFGEPLTFSEEEVTADVAPEEYVERCGAGHPLIGVGH